MLTKRMGKRPKLHMERRWGSVYCWVYWSCVKLQARKTAMKELPQLNQLSYVTSFWRNDNLELWINFIFFQRRWNDARKLLCGCRSSLKRTNKLSRQTERHLIAARIITTPSAWRISTRPFPRITRKKKRKDKLVAYGFRLIAKPSTHPAGLPTSRRKGRKIKQKEQDQPTNQKHDCRIMDTLTQPLPLSLRSGRLSLHGQPYRAVLGNKCKPNRGPFPINKLGFSPFENAPRRRRFETTPSRTPLVPFSSRKRNARRSGAQSTRGTFTVIKEGRGRQQDRSTNAHARRPPNRPKDTREKPKPKPKGVPDYFSRSVPAGHPRVLILSLLLRVPSLSSVHRGERNQTKRGRKGCFNFRCCLQASSGEARALYEETQGARRGHASFAVALRFCPRECAFPLCRSVFGRLGLARDVRQRSRRRCAASPLCTVTTARGR